MLAPLFLRVKPARNREEESICPPQIRLRRECPRKRRPSLPTRMPGATGVRSGAGATRAEFRVSQMTRVWRPAGLLPPDAGAKIPRSEGGRSIPMRGQKCYRRQLPVERNPPIS